MIVYHGTMDRHAKNIKDNGVLLERSKEFLDFGMGFYTSNDIRLAIKTACTVSGKTNSFSEEHTYPAIVQFSVDDLAICSLNIKRFVGQCDEWKRFVINNRLGKKYLDFFNAREHNINGQYDIVIGETADGTIGSFAQSIRDGEVPVNADIYKFSGFRKSLGRQISFHTMAAVSCISYVKYDIIRTREE